MGRNTTNPASVSEYLTDSVRVPLRSNRVLVTEGAKSVPAVTCDFCDTNDWVSHTAREMMFGLRHQFTYRECTGCGALCLVDPPADMNLYYPPADYYSFNVPTVSIGMARKAFYRAHLVAPSLMRRIRQCRGPFAAFAAVRPKRDVRVLDVGSGGGDLVGALRDLGIEALGIDAFVPQDVYDSFGLRVRRCELETLDGDKGAWDIIMFHHSLEHMPNHVRLLGCASHKLAPHGICIVRMPVVGWAWRHYGVDWVQLDPPRHLVLHTPTSFVFAARQAGFRVSRIVFDSNELQFWGSELYRRNIPMYSGRPLVSGKTQFGWRQMSSFRRRAQELNHQQDGDQAVFILERAEAECF